MSRSRWAAIAVAAAALAFSRLGVGLGVPACRSLAACLELRLAPALTNGYQKHVIPPPVHVKRTGRTGRSRNLAVACPGASRARGDGRRGRQPAPRQEFCLARSLSVRSPEPRSALRRCWPAQVTVPTPVTRPQHRVWEQRDPTVSPSGSWLAARGSISVRHQTEPTQSPRVAARIPVSRVQPSG
jgi:hypothetical protein